MSFIFLESRDIKKSRMCCFRRPPRYLQLTAILIIFECSQMEALPETITIGKIFRMCKMIKADIIFFELPVSENPINTSFLSPRPWIWRENIDVDPLSSEEMVKSARATHDIPGLKVSDLEGFNKNIDGPMIDPETMQPMAAE